MALSARGSVLVAGSAAQLTMEQPITVTVLRGFMFRSELVPVGSVVALPASVAHEVIGMGKAERYVAPSAHPVPIVHEEQDLRETEDAPARRGRPPKVKEQET